jgi:hypothetical protein
MPFVLPDEPLAQPSHQFVENLWRESEPVNRMAFEVFHI